MKNTLNVENEVIQFVLRQFKIDMAQTDVSKLTLLAKWMPSVNTSSAETRKLAKKFISALNWTDKKYRKTLSSLRNKINIVERHMCSNNWNEIEFAKVPSKAGLIYKNAFRNHTPQKYDNWVSDVASGNSKVNAATLYPYELVEKVLNGSYRNSTTSKALETSIQAIDNMWNALPDYFDGNSHNGLVVADVSSSMSGRPMAVSIAMALYISERCNGEFKNHFLTFAESPSFDTVRGSNIVEKVNNLSRANWGGSTNLQASFELILNKAIKHKVPQSDMPTTLYIVSDMEFNVACDRNINTNFEVIRSKYKTAGYEMPKIVFWNVNSRQDNNPVRFDERGTTLVSGCSPSILKTILSGKSVTPLDLMLETLLSERYAPVRA